MSELHDLTALQQAAALRRGEIDPVELVDHYLDRIDRLDGSVGAFVTVVPEVARAAAMEAAAALRRAGPAGLPPLLGVPIAIKDLTGTAGVRTTFGSAAYDDFVPAVDDNVVVKLRAAGTVSVGKTSSPEFGAACYTEPAAAPPARTPWDLARMAGGSSGGAAAAVAAGLVPFAHGNDAAGSIRIPASCCGLVGIKPSRDRVSMGPFGDATGMAVQGPLARTVPDAAALLDAMAGPMPGDITWAPPLREPLLAAAERDPGRLRIGRYRTPVIAAADVHPECVAAYEAATDLLTDLGHEVVDVGPPFGADVVPLFETVWWVRSTLVPVPPERTGLLRPLTTWLRAQGVARSGPEYVAASAQLTVVSRAAIAATAQYDAVLTPALAQPPLPLGALRDDADPAADFAAQERFTPFTAPYNITGQPAIVLPLHWTAGPAPLPIGVQLAGRPHDEATLVSLAAQLEAARPWAHRVPPAWTG
ncbi:MAG: amidase [Frankiaceae bacterium]